jgi:hypothetical protein
MAKNTTKAAADKAQAASDRKKAIAANNKAAAAKPASAAKPAPVQFNSELDEEEKALFLNHHLPAVRAGRAAVNKATADLRNAYKKAKAEGNFTKADFDTAFAVETAESEARERGKIARQLRIAKIMGSSLGAQLDMFLEPDRTPAADIAYEEGRTASMKNEAAKPKYDPSTEQFRRYMAGFHEHQATIAKGIKPTNEAVKEDVKATAEKKATVAQQKAVDAQAFDEPSPDAAADIPSAPSPAPSSAVPMTRAQFKKQQEEAKAREAAG